MNSTLDSRSFLIRMIIVLLGMTLLASCANVPRESQPEVISIDETGQSDDAPQPARDLDVLSVVRNFVHASAFPGSDNAGARAYLDESARRSWQPTPGTSIVEDLFATVYAPPAQQVTGPGEQVVLLRGFTVGTLAADKSFISVKNPYEFSIKLKQQADGQWRIIQPPPDLIITQSDFLTNFVRVPVYFFAPNTNATVPDLRYIPAKPHTKLAGQVVDLLLAGPSGALASAVRNPLDNKAGLEGAVTTQTDGALTVPLTGVSEQSPENKQLIAAQIVLSLQSVVTNRVRLLSNGMPLISGQGEWLPSDLPAYAAEASPSSDLPGLVAVDSRIRSLADGVPIPGPAGAGVYRVITAARSLDGERIALIEQTGDGQRLRVGNFGEEVQVVDLSGAELSRPTWRPGGTNEVWTVVDGSQVVRVQRTSDAKWTRQLVNIGDISAIGRITELRLSRDGARVALVADGRLVVASVVRDQDSVSLRAPRILKGGELTNIEDVDWVSQDTVVVATSSPALPVAKVPVDGLRLDAFNSANLTLPVRAITAAPSRPIVVSDGGGLWMASDVGEVWRPHSANFGPQSTPFYPG